jgi:PKD repeat protein
MMLRCRIGRAAFVTAGTILAVATCREIQAPDPSSTAGPPVAPNLSTSPTGSPVVFVGAGDVASCSRSQDEATLALVDAEIAANPDAVVFTVGDNAYDTGTAAEFTNCYGPSWGRYKTFPDGTRRTYPTPGNRDYTTAGAPGYFGYFADVLAGLGEAASDPARGWYSYDLGDWHLVVLNSEVPMGAGSTQLEWLKADLAASTKACTIAYWHEPRFYSSGGSSRSAAAWEALYAAGADIVMGADRRNYERFAPQRPDGTPDPGSGIRQFIIGTGGGGSYMSHGTPLATSEVRIKQYGVLRLTLGSGTYSWKFLPIAGKTETDEGSGTCGTGPLPIARPGGPYTSDGSVAFDGSASSDPQEDVPLTYAWDFGDPADPAPGTGPTPTHAYSRDGTYTVTLVVTDSRGNRSLPATTTAVIGPPASGPVVFIGAGDIADCTRTQDDETAALLDAEILANPDALVFALGDNAYNAGTQAEYTDCYGPSWGRHKARTRPTPGNKDYTTAGAPGYFTYFADVLEGLGPTAGDPTKGYYSFDVGDWHVVVLNQNVPIGASSAQIAWLKADLAASSKACTIAYWHNPRFWSGGSTSTYIAAWDVLYAAGADVVLNADRRNYERFAPQRPDGTADPDNGIRQFIAGTAGGDGLTSFGTTRANSEVRIKAFGVLKLMLGAGAYSWKFIPTSGTITDQGSANCHRQPLPIARPGGPYAGEASVTFDGSASSDPQRDTPLTYEWDFGDPADPTPGTGPTPTHVYTADGTYTVTLVVVDSKGNRSMPATTTVEIRKIPPIVDAGADQAVATGTPLAYNGSFSDASVDGAWTYRISWGDGTPDATGDAAAAGSVGASHTYAVAGSYTIRLTVADARGLSASDEAVVSVSDPVTAVTMLTAGDIAACGATGLEDEATAQLIDGFVATIPDAVVFTIGDNAYPHGRAEDYANCYHPTWGRHKDRTWANIGNHEYDMGNADPTWDYFGDRAGPRGKGYYSLDIGDWHVIVLNDNASFVPIAANSEQDIWLRDDLAANTKKCTLAIWHQPFMFSANIGGTMKRASRKILWDRLWAAGADVVLNGHEHHYERLAPMRPDGTRDDESGIRSFVVGTGGGSVRMVSGRAPNSEVLASAFGIMKLKLGAGWYEWEFVPIAGETFRDSGSGVCH